jgi:hypothetical protein
MSFLNKTLLSTCLLAGALCTSPLAESHVAGAEASPSEPVSAAQAAHDAAFPPIDKPVLSMIKCIGFLDCSTPSFTCKAEPLRDSVVWSGTSRPSPISSNKERKNPSVCRSGKWKSSRIVRAVSIAQSEYVQGAPRRPDGLAFQALIASGEIHRVRSPRLTRAWSYSGQLVTWYFALKSGWTLEFMPGPSTNSARPLENPRSWTPMGRELCTNAPRFTTEQNVDLWPLTATRLEVTR